MFELMGLVVTGGGIILTGLSLFGVFSDKEKIGFFERIFKTEDAIPKEGMVFEDFVKSFPPEDLSCAISEIMARRMDCSSTGMDVFSSVYYLENGLPGKFAVATESEVKEWAYKTSVTFTGLVITAIGFVLQVVKYVVSL
ncbi:MAG: hypothetical protein V3T17_05260 [Pseudomonadales bacterium]